MNPEQLLYAKTHEWVSIDEDSEGGKIATIGISAFALEALTDLVFVELPEVGRQLKVGEALGEIESVKAVSDLYSPVTGEIVEINRSLPDQLETIGEDPYGAGWMVKIRVADDSALGDLMDAAAYRKQCEEEGA